MALNLDYIEWYKLVYSDINPSEFESDKIQFLLVYFDSACILSLLYLF